MISTLLALKTGQKARIVRIGGKGVLKQRLLDMGVMRGVEVTMERPAPLGDPIEVMIKGYYLAIRKDEARHISVER